MVVRPMDNNSLDTEAAMCSHSRVHEGVDVVEAHPASFKNLAFDVPTVAA
jgi:hypothetical protein